MKHKDPGELILLVDSENFVSKDEGWWVQVPDEHKDPLEILINEETNQEDQDHE